jgi:hypothetical protein
MTSILVLNLIIKLGEPLMPDGACFILKDRKAGRTVNGTPGKMVLRASRAKGDYGQGGMGE